MVPHAGLKFRRRGSRGRVAQRRNSQDSDHHLAETYRRWRELVGVSI